MRVAAILLVVASAGLGSFGQDVHIEPRAALKPKPGVERAGFTEVTVHDVTELAELRSTELCTLGVALGDAEERMRSSSAERGWQLAVDPRLGCCTASIAGEPVALFEVKGGRVERVVWYAALAKYLAGRAAKLLDADVGLPDSPVRLSLLGREDRHTLEHSAYLPDDATYSYDREGIRIVYFADGETRVLTLQLVTPAKMR